jgi:hypothetical protein
LSEGKSKVDRGSSIKECQEVVVVVVDNIQKRRTRKEKEPPRSNRDDDHGGEEKMGYVRKTASYANRQKDQIPKTANQIHRVSRIRQE